MASRLIHQSKTTFVKKTINNTDALKFSEAIYVPFLVDEIRVTNITVTPYVWAVVIDTVQRALTIEINSPNLLGSVGTFLGCIHHTTLGGVSGNIDGGDPNKSYGLRSFASTSDGSCPYQARYVYPPGARRSIGGTYNFEVTSVRFSATTQTIDPIIVGSDPLEMPPSVLTLTIEFIQYVERERSVEDDLQPDLVTMVKSGRRRL